MHSKDSQDTTNDQADLGAVASYRNGRAAHLCPFNGKYFMSYARPIELLIPFEPIATVEEKELD